MLYQEDSRLLTQVRAKPKSLHHVVDFFALPGGGTSCCVNRVVYRFSNGRRLVAWSYLALVALTNDALWEPLA